MRPLALVAAALALGGCGSSDGGSAPAQIGGGTTTAATPVSVEDAIARGDGELLVRGYVIANVDEYRLCERILESDPPQCGEPSLLIQGLDPADLRRLFDAQRPVSALGLVDGRTIHVHSVRD